MKHRLHGYDSYIISFSLPCECFLALRTKNSITITNIVIERKTTTINNVFSNKENLKIQNINLNTFR